MSAAALLRDFSNALTTISPPVWPMPKASVATNSAFLTSGIGGTLIQTMLAPRACASSAGCVNKGGATLTTTSTSGLVSSSARNICAWRCGSNVVGPDTPTLTLPPRSLAAALGPARISVLHSPAASASTTETVTESLAAAYAGAQNSATAARPLNMVARQSMRAFSLFDIILLPPLTHLLLSRVVVVHLYQVHDMAGKTWPAKRGRAHEARRLIGCAGAWRCGRARSRR